MTTEAKSVAESFLSNLKFQTSSDEEIAAREAELKARALRERGLEYLAKASIPAKHRNVTPAELRGAPWLNLQSRIEAKIGTGFIIGVVGRRGTGKTQLAVQIAKAVANAGKRPLYSTAMGFFLDIKESFRDKAGSEKEVIERYCAPAYLIIDEMQERGETPWEDRLLTHLIDRRYQSEKDTLLISNQTKENFLLSIGESISSRIIETGGVTSCDWESYRTK
jgi:DNA replication protein DnaC